MSSRRRRTSVVLYDTDSLNPYGRELAALLASQTTLTYCCPASVQWVPSEMRTWRILATARGRDGLWKHVLLRVFGPLVAVLSAALSRKIVVVAWTRGWWDAWVFARAVPLLRALIVVNHNPTAIRHGSRRLRTRAEMALKRSATATVVHSGALVSAALADSRTVRLAPHPPYSQWRKHFGRAEPPEERGRTVAFLGGARQDKGLGDFVATLIRMRTRPLRASFIGRGELDSAEMDQLLAAGITVEGPSPDFLDDVEFAARLESVTLVLAPYSSITQSGSVVMALTFDKDVIAYQGGGVTELLTRQSLVTPNDVAGMARQADAYFELPWVSACQPPETMRRVAAEAWDRVLEEFAEGGDS